MMKLSIARRRMSLLSLTAAAGLWGSSVADAQNYIVPRGRAYATPYCPPTQPQYCPPGMLPPGSYPQPSPEHAPRPLPPTPSDPTPTPRRDPTPSSDPMDPSQTPSTDSQQQTPETPETPEQPTQPQTQNNQTSPNSSNQNLSASTSSSSQQVAPGMIGDFFGTGPIGTGRLQTDSFHASLQPVMIPGGGIYMLPATEHYLLVQRPRHTALGPYTGVSLQPLPIVVDQASRPDSNGIGFVTGDSTDRFTTVESERQVFNRIEQEGIGATFDLRDNPDVLAAVEDLALARLGNGGVVEFLGGDAEFLNFYGRRNGFVSEDVNSNGILDPGEDINSNGMLDLALPGQLLEFDPRWDYGYFVEVPVIGGNVGALPGANVGRSKLTESASPIPRDRLFFNYSYFDNAALTPAGVDVSRLTTGFEKTFWCQRASIEVRLPAASTLDATIPISGPIESGEQELGNLTMYLKGLLWQWERLAISGGVGWTLPTAPGVNVVDPITENTIYRVENSSVHVLPFLGALWTPTPRFFMQGFLQFDLDSNGNRVYVSDVDNRGRFNGNLYGVGRAEDHGFAYFDMGIGYWAYLNTTNRGWITAIAPTIEYHLNTTIDNPGDFRGVGRNGLIYDFGSADNITSSNIVVGVNTMLRRGWNVTAGATFGAGDDKQFDGEFRLIINKYFGGSNTGTPIPSF